MRERGEQAEVIKNIHKYVCFLCFIKISIKLNNFHKE